MAGYDAIETRVQTILQTLSSDFASTDVVRADYSVLDTGSPPLAIITSGGGRTLNRGGNAYRSTEWRLQIEVLVRFTTQATARETLLELVDRIYQKLESYPTLNSLTGINAVSISVDGEPQERRPEAALNGSAPIYLSQIISLSVIEQWIVSGGEY